jgi:hypothetical protein
VLKAVRASLGKKEEKVKATLAKEKSSRTNVIISFYELGWVWLNY